MTDVPSAATTAGARDRNRGRTAAQWFCYIVGPVLILAGLLGFTADGSFEAGNGVDGDTLLGLEVNGWHNLVHAASGLFLLVMASKRASARLASIAFGLIYAVVTVIGLVDGSDILGILPVNGADNVLHIVLTITAIAAGLSSPADDRGTRSGSDAVETVGAVETRDRGRTGAR